MRGGGFRFPNRFEPWLAGMAATLVTAMLSWRPSFWFDEAATVAAADRSEIDLLRLLLNFDAVHGLYYLVMHMWLSWVPINEFTVRLPSAVAVGIAAAGLMVLTKLVADRPTAWAAAVAFTVLPRTLWAAVEARSSALTAAMAVWLTVVCVLAAARGGAVLWSLYAFVLALAVLSFVYLGLLVFAHALTVAASWPRRRLVPFVAAVTAGLILASPLVAVAASQRHQISWIDTISGGATATALWEQWFTHSRLFLCVSIVVLGWGTVILVLRHGRGHAAALGVALPWVVVPTVLLIGYSVIFRNIYQPRYLTYTTPGLGLLLGVCVVAIARDQTRYVVFLLGVLALSASTAFVGQRNLEGKPGGADYFVAAELIATHAHPRDCVIFGSAPREPLRAIATTRPAAFALLDDVAAGVSGPEAAQLWSQDLPWDSDVVRPRLANCAVLWVIVDQQPDPPLVSAARHQRFSVDQRWVLHRTVVLRLSR